MFPKNPNSSETAILSSTEIKRKARLLPTTDDLTSSSGDTTRIILFILGMIERVDFSQTPIITLGRFERQHKTAGQLDLSLYGAIDRGVSRIHCQIENRDGDILVTDLGSSNGTFVSGNRLEPNHPHMLKKGEEIVLGRLPIQVMSGR